MKIVVSRYKEDIKWTFSFPNVVLYNKGPPIPDLYTIPLANVGREGHTYYQYIIDHYDELDDYTAFLQGNPFDHSPNIMRTLSSYIDGTKTFKDFAYLSEHSAPTNCKRCPLWNKIPMKEVYDYLFHDCPQRIAAERKRSWNITFGPGAQFIVSRERILARPREFYQRVIRLLEYSSDPIEGHAIERYHSLIFS